mmetsp:Transcript_38158/g.105148  ORF Transcript_38158/g.105148 Transcript_38158/m.105148 type:complete len:178 (-) Transcript_38158:237-770(-)
MGGAKCTCILAEEVSAAGKEIVRTKSKELDADGPEAKEDERQQTPPDPQAEEEKRRVSNCATTPPSQIPAVSKAAEKSRRRRSSRDANDPLTKLKAVLRKRFKDPIAAFNALDLDGDKALEPSEFRKMLENVGKNAGWDEETIKTLSGSAKNIFAHMDTNKDGHVTVKEFRKSFSSV